MKPYTRDDAETDLQAALDTGDLEAALRHAGHLDHLPPKPAPTLAGAALWYATRGLPVFPLQPASKLPWRGTHGVKDATTDPDRIRSWWTSGPGFAESNIGLATGHVVDVIDFDGLEGHADWGRQYPTWDDAERVALGTVSTPRPGGFHLYTHATGAGNLAGYVGAHVDYRGLGGYVVAPPSRLDNRGDQHPGTYRWLRPLEVQP